MNQHHDDKPAKSTKVQCGVHVRVPGTTFPRYRHCTRTAITTNKEGKPVCKQHSDEAKAARDQRREERWHRRHAVFYANHLHATKRMDNAATSPAFDVWWDNEGSGMRPLPGEDAGAHVHRICQIAWANGADKMREELVKLRTEINCRIEHGADSGGHLEYAQSRLDEILNTTTTPP